MFDYGNGIFINNFVIVSLNIIVFLELVGV